MRGRFLYYNYLMTKSYLNYENKLDVAKCF